MPESLAIKSDDLFVQSNCAFGLCNLALRLDSVRWMQFMYTLYTVYILYTTSGRFLVEVLHRVDPANLSSV